MDGGSGIGEEGGDAHREEDDERGDDEDREEDGSSSDDLDAADVEPGERDDHRHSDRPFQPIVGFDGGVAAEQGEERADIAREEGWIDGGIDPGIHPRPPAASEAPERTHAPLDPDVVAAFVGKRRGEFSGEEGCGGGPDDGRDQDKEDRHARPGLHEALESVGSAAHIEEEGHRERPEQKRSGRMLANGGHCEIM